MRYIALIDGGPGAYGVVFPDLPGCTAMADTLDQAMTSAADALRDWINTVETDGNTVPAARSAEALRTDPEVSEALSEGASLAAILVVRSTGKPVRANLSLDEGIVSAIDAAARKRGVTRSAMVEILARQHLPEMA
jgi:predicted RNase H-like HicB family nuclease